MIVHQLFSNILDTKKIENEMSFSQLGGSSKAYESLSKELNARIDDLPSNWSELSILELEALLTESERKFNQRLKAQKLSNANTLRAIFCFLVVSFHVFGSSPSFGLNIDADSSFRTIFSVLELIRMPLFTALAGMLFVAKSRSVDEFPSFIKSRAITLLLPAFIVSLIYFFLRTAIGKETGELLQSIVHGYMHLWFLYALFIILLVVGFIHIVFKPTFVGYITMMIVFFCLSLLLKNVDFFRVYEAAKLAPYFILGMLLYSHRELLLDFKIVTIALLITLAGCVLKVALFYSIVELPDAFQPMWVIVSLSFIIVIYRFTPKFESLEWVKIYTYAIYLWHPMANAAVRTTFEKVGIDNKASLFVIGIIAGLFIPIVMYKVIRIFPVIVRQSLMGR